MSRRRRRKESDSLASDSRNGGVMKPGTTDPAAGGRDTTVNAERLRLDRRTRAAFPGGAGDRIAVSGMGNGARGLR